MANNSSSTRNFIPMANKYDRVVLLVDMDCFYCQVEEKLDPSLKNKPLAVVQYNAWRGGGIIAVNYAARAKGVTRHMRGDEAKEQCPDIQLAKVPNVREKADLTKYREAGKDVANVLQRFTPLLERASVDEAYLDITEAVNKRLKDMNDGTFILQPQELVNTYACGFATIGEFVTTITSTYTNARSDDDDFYRNFNENDVPAVRQSSIRLLIGASIASEIRAAVKAETTYECSAGIAHNKILAKLACGINKPNKQTLLPLAQIPGLFETLPIGKIKGLGAKFGEEVCERFGVRYLGQLLKFTEAELQKKFDEKNGSWLYNISRGIDLEAVTPRFYSKSIGCCKKFPGRNNITGLKTLQHWLNELANEIYERLEKDICENNRRAKQMVVNFIQEFDGEELSSSRSAPLQSYDTESLAKTCLEIIKVNTKQFFRAGSESVLNNPIKFLGISVGKFETISSSQNNIQEMFAQQAAKKKKLSADEKPEQKTKTTPNVNNNTVALSTLDVSKESKIIQETSSSRTHKEIKKTDVRSFFLNALKKPPQTETKTQSDANNLNDNVNGEIDLSIKITKSNSLSKTQTSFNKDTSSTELQNCTTSDNLTKIPQKSFFAKVLKKETDAVDIPAVNSVDISDINSNENPSNCNELNDLINDLNKIEEEKDDEKEIQLISMISTQNLQTESCSNNDETTITKNISEQVSNTSNKRKYDHVSDESNLKDYRSQYAEFAIPELRAEFLQFTNCSICGAKILSDPLSVQTHQDHHYAQELSQQQRHEFRDEIRTKINSSKSSPNNVLNKKSKKIQALNDSTTKKSLNADITKFLKPSLQSSSDSNQTLTSECDMTVATEICDICKIHVKIEDILEHKDFHMAKELQRKLNQLDVHTVEVVKKSTPELTRKNMNSSMITSSRQGKVVAAKPITQFFTQSN